jgi:hypothetical protein
MLYDESHVAYQTIQLPLCDAFRVRVTEHYMCFPHVIVTLWDVNDLEGGAEVCPLSYRVT